MDKTLVENWNRIVHRNDTVYIVGDFIFRAKCTPDEYLSVLKGRKHLIIGNHDSKLLKNEEAMAMFVESTPYLKLDDKGRQVILCHYPIAEWDGYFRDKCYHLFGHVHNNFKNPWHGFMSKLHNCWNVGVDVTGYRPVTLDELIEGNVAHI
jgi:calcineurin-like phosphoesterase family protein